MHVTPMPLGAGHGSHHTVRVAVVARLADIVFDCRSASTLAGFWASVSLQRALPSSTISLSYLAVPAWGLIASTLWLGEGLPPSLILGGALIFLGVAAIALGDAWRR